MAFTKIVPAGINTTNSYTLQELNTVGVLTAGTIQVGSATTIHSTGIDLGSAGIVTAMTISAMYGNFTGDVNAANFIGNGSNLSGIDATAIKDENGAVKIQGNPSGAVHSGVSTFYDLDVDAHAYLDNVNISGVSTFSNSLIVSKNSSTMPPIQINNLDMTSNTNQPFLYFSSGSGSKGSIGVNYGDSTTYIHGENGIKFRYGGSAPGTTEALGITSTGKLEAYKGTSTTGKTLGSEAFTVGNGANNKRFSVYPDGSTVIGGQGVINNYNILLQNNGQAVFSGIGIGTATPGRHLTVSGGASEGAIQITNNTSGHNQANGFELIHFTSGETQFLNRENGAMRFDTNGVERLRITSTGNIGIGENNPTQKLVVKGTTSLMATNSTNQWMAYTYTDNTFRLNYNGAGADEVTINSNGDVSLLQNLIIPEDKKIFLEGDADDDYNAIWKDDAENALMLTSRYNIANIIDSNNDDTDSFWSVRHNGVDIAGSGELMRVQSNGLVGINCTPLAQLQVKAGTNANIALTTMSSEAAIEVFNDAGNANVPFRLRASEHKFFIDGTQRARLSYSSSSAVFSLGDESNSAGHIRLEAKASENQIHGRSNHPIAFLINTSEKLRIDTAGNLIQANYAKLYNKNNNNLALIAAGESTPTVYVSDSGSDSTGDGTSSSPFRTISKAWEHIPKVYTHNQTARIMIKGSSYTIDTTYYARGGNAGGNWQWGPATEIRSESGSQIDVYLRGGVRFENVDGLRFNYLNFICDNANGYLNFDSCTRGKIYNTCDMSVTATKGWSSRIEYNNCRGFVDDMDIDVASAVQSGLGALVVINNKSIVEGSRYITKAGSQFNNHGVSIVNGSHFSGNWDITNFATGISLGLNHYNAETGGTAMLNGTAISNCARGLRVWNNSFVRKYSVSYSSNSTNEDIQSGSFVN
tara:strand:- start:425 stop:3199 length:2775 start_codon:yes stop_codon:yes gene_type:complete